ncbi:MAG TPA: hypothetical protein VGH38_06590 [Bryobacteraceae bacterium]
MKAANQVLIKENLNGSQTQLAAVLNSILGEVPAVAEIVESHSHVGPARDGGPGFHADAERGGFDPYAKSGQSVLPAKTGRSEKAGEAASQQNNAVKNAAHFSPHFENETTPFNGLTRC